MRKDADLGGQQIPGDPQLGSGPMSSFQGAVWALAMDLVKASKAKRQLSVVHGSLSHTISGNSPAVALDLTPSLPIPE